MRIAPPSIQHPHFDNRQMHNREEVKREKLHRKHNEKIDEYEGAKNADWHKAKLEAECVKMIRDVREINQYLNLKQHIEYANYRYGFTLGNYLDVYV